MSIGAAVRNQVSAADFRMRATNLPGEVDTRRASAADARPRRGFRRPRTPHNRVWRNGPEAAPRPPTLLVKSATGSGCIFPVRRAPDARAASMESGSYFGCEVGGHRSERLYERDAIAVSKPSRKTAAAATGRHGRSPRRSKHCTSTFTGGSSGLPHIKNVPHW